jgi:thiamine-phosphate pyrophosphorylase
MSTLDNYTLRIIDANLNRTAEGLRVIEDIARLYLNNGTISTQLKNMRHQLVYTSSELQQQLLWARDAASDIGKDILVPGEPPAKELASILVANSRRVQESLRVLEELTKAPGMPSELISENYKQTRFRLYALEQDILARLLRQDKIQKLKGLYVIIDGQWLKGRRHAEVMRAVIRGGAQIIQLREKIMVKRDIVTLARELRHICAEENVLFFINDYLDVALDCNADGLHIGQEDIPAAAARRLLKPDQLLGVTANTVENALAAQSDGADHIGVGAMFSTSSKEDVHVVGINRIIEIRNTVSLPVVAIGGINRTNIGTVLGSGAAAVAVISAVVSADDPEQAARELVNIIKEKK